MANNPFMSAPDVGQQGNAPQERPANPFMSAPDVGQQVQNQQEEPSGMSGMFNAASSFLDPIGSAAANSSGQVNPNSTFMDKVEIMNRGFQRTALGGLQLINRGLRETVGRLSPALTEDSRAFDQQLAASNQRGEQRYQEAYARTPSPITSMAGQLGGSIIGTVPATIAGGPGAAAAVGRGVASGALAGLEDYSASDSERLTKTAVGGLAGGALTGAAVGISALGKTLFPSIGVSSFVQKVFSPKKAAIQDIAGNIKADAGNDAAAALAKVNRVRAEGIQGRTPGEAIPGPITRAHELSAVADDIDKAAVAKVATTSQNYGKKEIYKAIANMATPQTKALQKDSFKAMAQEYIDNSGKLTTAAPTIEKRSVLGEVGGTEKYIPDVIKSNKILSQKYNNVMNAESSAVRNLPDNSVAKLHKIKDAIDADLYNAEPNKAGVIAKVISPDKKNALIEAKSQLTSLLEQSPSYNAAMAATQKIKTQEWYEAAIRGKAVKAGQGGKLSVDELHQALFNSTAQKQKFIKDVAATGGDPEQAQKVLQLSDSLRQSPLMRVMKRMNSGESVVSVYGRDAGMIQNLVSKLTLDKYRKALLDVTLSGDKWADDISKVLSAKEGASQAKKYFELMLKAAGTGAVGAVSKSVASKYGVEGQ